jgi:hypothetical protein
MPEQIWAGKVASTTARNRDGTRKAYSVTLAADGTGTCACVNYILEGINKQNPAHRCKHIRQAADNPEYKALVARTRLAGIGAAVRASRADKAPQRPGAAPQPAPVPPAPGDGLGLSPGDITRVARRGRPRA